VVKVLLAIPDRLRVNVLPRSHFGLSKAAFVFLFIFDYMSVAQRKNPFGLVEAFRKAFRKKDDVMLVLKSVHSERHPEDANELTDLCKDHNIRIMDGVLSRKEVTSLIRAADCYASLHRSEGFGLTLAEAMSFEKPVIATGFSGNMEFMNPANSYLVKYQLTDINEDYGPYRGGVWADPDVDHAAELMRYIYKNRGAAIEVGRRARRDILQLFSEERAGVLMRDRLLRLADLGKISGSAGDVQLRPGRVQRSNGFYRELVTRVREAAESKIPRGSSVLVVSKGDPTLVDLKDRTAFHFPQAPDGRYAGHHPADSNDAIQQLEELKNKGARYLLFPQTSFWWLDYYADLQSHLQNQYWQIWSDPDCIIYQLSEESPNRRGRVSARTSAKKRS
jgi:hypothetical protein